MKLDLACEIEVERRAQDHRWGGPEHDDMHSLSDWSGYLEYQIARLKYKSGDERYTLIKIAALAVAAIESQDRIMEKAIPF